MNLLIRTVKKHEHCKKVLKKHVNKNLIMSEEEEQFQLSNTCRICKKLVDNDAQKVTAKFRGAAHWDCNINLQLTKKVPLIFHNLRG